MSVESSRKQDMLNIKNKLVDSQESSQTLRIMNFKLYFIDCLQRNYDICSSFCLKSNPQSDVVISSCFNKCNSKRLQGCNETYSFVQNKTFQDYIKSSKVLEEEYDL